MIRYPIVLFLLFVSCVLPAQQISFLNPGFEDSPRLSYPPQEWVDCGFPGESPPDIMPNGSFNVDLPSYSGRSYMSLVTRDNGTWESAGARLTRPLQQDRCYQFRLAIAHSEQMLSRSRLTNQEAYFSAPVRLLIWGGKDACDRAELLAESPLIQNIDWQIYSFLILPLKGNHSHIILEASYGNMEAVPYNGNVFVDAASVFTPLEDCTLPGLDEVPEPEVAAALDQDEPIILAPPAPEFWEEEERMRFYLSNVLGDISFTPELAMIPSSFQLEGESIIREGHPALYAMAVILSHHTDRNWALVVIDQDAIAAEIIALKLEGQLKGYGLTNVSSRAYNPELDDGRQWFCMSARNGLYLAETSQ